jgi:hypothetical protein
VPWDGSHASQPPKPARSEDISTFHTPAVAARLPLALYPHPGLHEPNTRARCANAAASCGQGAGGRRGGGNAARNVAVLDDHIRYRSAIEIGRAGVASYVPTKFPRYGAVGVFWPMEIRYMHVLAITCRYLPLDDTQPYGFDSR